MNSVVINARAVKLTNRAVSGFRWVGCTHDIAVTLDRVFAFKNAYENWAAAHEVCKVIEERALAVNSVELFRGCLVHLKHASSNNLEALLFEHRDDVTSVTSSNGIRLYNREGLFNF